ncbi:cysteinyl leukotriene receptor 1 [Biomphalaria glabrata]|nr:cysteinyl leukotriene receptor 1 [Biomphalaria glabrata]
MSFDQEQDIIYPSQTVRSVRLLAATVSLASSGNRHFDSEAHANFASPDYESATSKLGADGPGLTQHHNDYLSIFLDGHGTTLASANNTYSPTESFYEQFLNRSEFKMREDLFRYVSPVVILLGNITNIIALFVLRRKKLRRTSVCFYMCAYALANLCVLNLMLGVIWMCDMFQLEYVTYIADWTCRLWTFVNNVFTYCGLWFVVAMNIDRLIFLTSRSNAQSHCTVFSAKASVMAIMVGLIVVSIHAMWTYELQSQGCFVAFEPYDLHKVIWPWLSATVYSYLPLSLLICLNVAQAIAICVKHVREVPISQPADGCQDTFVVTVMVVSLSAFIFNMPATVTNVLDIHVPSSWISVEFVAKMELIKKITELLSSLNHVLLGIQLFACSREFRHEFLALLRVVFCCFTSKRTFKMFEMSPAFNSEDSSSPHRQVDYQLCNNNEETVTSV